MKKAAPLFQAHNFFPSGFAQSLHLKAAQVPPSALGLPSRDANSTQATVWEGAVFHMFHTALDQCPKPPTFQMRAALSHSHSQIQKSAPYFLGKLPAKDVSANVMFSVVLNGEMQWHKQSRLPGDLCDLEPTKSYSQFLFSCRWSPAAGLQAAWGSLVPWLGGQPPKTEAVRSDVDPDMCRLCITWWVT